MIQRALIGLAIARCLVLQCAVVSANDYQDAVLADKPVAYYQFEETSGTIAVDSTGNGHEGDYKGGVILGERSAYPVLGRAATFGAAESRMQIPAHEAFKFGKDDFTIEFWFNCCETLSTRGDIFTYKGEGKDVGISKPFGNSNLLALSRPFRPFQAQTDPFSIGAWHHAAYVRRSGIDRWFVDGELSGTATISRQTIDMNVDILVGANHDGGPEEINQDCVWNGLIDEFAIYRRALSTDRVEAHYKAARQQPFD